MTIAPENKPPVPIPAIALPTINATLLGAVAQTSELLHGQPQVRLSREQDVPKLKEDDGSNEHKFDL
jgi:hypothetical protein